MPRPTMPPTAIPPDLWRDIESHVMELMISAYEAGFAAGSGRPALDLVGDDTYTQALLAETERRWWESLETLQAMRSRAEEPLLPPSEIPAWLGRAQEESHA